MTPVAPKKSWATVSTRPVRAVMTVGSAIRPTRAVATWAPTTWPRSPPPSRAETCAAMAVSRACWTTLSPSSSLIRVLTVVSSACHRLVSESSWVTAAPTATPTAASMSGLARRAASTVGSTEARSPATAAEASWPAASDRALTTPVAPKKSVNTVSTSPTRAVLNTGLVTNATTAVPTWAPTTWPKSPPPSRAETSAAICCWSACWTVVSPRSPVINDTAVVFSACHSAESPSNCPTVSVTVTPTAAWIAVLARSCASTCGNTEGRVPSRAAAASWPAAVASAETTPCCPKNVGTNAPMVLLSASTTA